MRVRALREGNSCGKRGGLVEIIRRKAKMDALNYISDFHWPFTVQARYIRKFYN